jgi:hypothetical protein
MKVPTGYDDRILDALTLAVDCGFPPSPYFRDILQSGKGLGSALIEKGVRQDQPIIEFGTKGGDLTYSLWSAGFSSVIGVESRSLYRNFFSRFHQMPIHAGSTMPSDTNIFGRNDVLIVRDEWVALGNDGVLTPSFVRAHSALIVVVVTKDRGGAGVRSEDGSLIRWSSFDRWFRTATAHHHMGVKQQSINLRYSVAFL